MVVAAAAWVLVIMRASGQHQLLVCSNPFPSVSLPSLMPLFALQLFQCGDKRSRPVATIPAQLYTCIACLSSLVSTLCAGALLSASGDQNLTNCSILAPLISVITYTRPPVISQHNYFVHWVTLQLALVSSKKLQLALLGSS